MTLMLQLSPGAEAALRARAEAEGRPAEEIAAEALSDLFDPAASVTDAVIDPEVVEGIRRGLADVEAGRFINLEDYATQHETARRQRGTLP